LAGLKDLVRHVTQVKPIVSVVLAVYNGSRYIREAIESILNQTFEDFELLVIDDGSVDDSVQIVSSYADPRIVITKLEHVGLVSGLNVGLGIAKGDFIARMDADDRARPSRLAVQHEFLLSHPEVAIVCSDIATIDADGKTTGQQIQRWPDNNLLRDGLLYRRTIKPLIHPTVMMRSEVIRTLGGYRAFDTCEDHDLWLRAIDRYQFHRINHVLLDYRIYGGGVSRTKAVNQATNSSMSAVTYLVRKTTGVDIFNERPDIFSTISDQVRQIILSEINLPASAFRDARLKMLTGQRIVGVCRLIYALARFGTTALPYKTTQLVRHEIEQSVANACAALRSR
jgi:glycosyltransferase involved in cell wall biosynthesis